MLNVQDSLLNMLNVWRVCWARRVSPCGEAAACWFWSAAAQRSSSCPSPTISPTDLLLLSEKAQPIVDICRWASSMLFFFALNGNFSKTSYFWGQITLEMFFTWEKLAHTLHFLEKLSLHSGEGNEFKLSTSWVKAQVNVWSLGCQAKKTHSCILRPVWPHLSKTESLQWTTLSGRAWECYWVRKGENKNVQE